MWEDRAWRGRRRRRGGIRLPNERVGMNLCCVQQNDSSIRSGILNYESSTERPAIDVKYYRLVAFYAISEKQPSSELLGI